MDATLSLLDKKFAHSWSSWSVVAGMNQDTLDQVINGFDKLDKKSKIRFIIALLGLDPSRRSSLMPSIKRLLAMAFDCTDEWVAVLASIVHTRLLPGVADHGQHKAGELLEESAQHVVNGILEAGGEDAAAGGELNYFAPLEYKYLGSHRCPAAEVSGHMSFKYIGSRPEFIQRERSAQKALAQDTKRGTSVLSSRVSTTKLFAQDRPDPDGGSLRRASGGLLPLKPLYKPSVEHKAPIMLPFSQTKELEAAHNLQQKQQLKKRSSDGGAAETQVAKMARPSPAAEEAAAVAGSPPDKTQQKKPEAPPASSGPDLTSLFAQSPLLSAEEKSTIEKFFTDSWRNYFMDREQILKFRLKEEDKCKDGVQMKETFFLNLMCSNHSWSKTKKTSKLSAL